jgi:glutathione S-transferase
MSIQPRLITIPFSHYCEKARWALEHAGVSYTEEPHLPIFHRLALWRVGADRMVPVLVEGSTVITDSTDIIAWADTRRPGALIPTGDALRREALALEDDFDQRLGPAARRWAFLEVLARRDLADLLEGTVSSWQLFLFKLSRPLAVQILRRAYEVHPAEVERSREQIDATFRRVSDLLRDGRRYLIGDRFSVADLTFAALAAPILLPPKHPARLPALGDFTPASRERVEHWRASPAGRHALEMYARERHERSESHQRLGVFAT